MWAAIEDLFRPQVFFFLLIPPLIFLLVAIMGCFWLWTPLSDSLLAAIQHTLISRWISPDLIGGILLFFAMMLILIPVLIVLTTVFFSVLLVPTLVRMIQKKDFRDVQLRPQGLNSKSVWISLKLSTLYLALVILTFPLNFLMPPLAFALNWLALGYFNARLFSREIMDEILPAQEAENFLKQHQSTLTQLSLITAVLYFVPVLNLLEPTWTALAMARYCFQITRYDLSVEP